MRIGFVVERIVPDVRVGAEYVRGSQVQYHGNGIALCRARRLLPLHRDYDSLTGSG
jgi:hypothetical protein